MTTQPEQLKLKDAQAMVAPLHTSDAIKARKFFDGDHWQDGDGWIGQLPPATDPNRGTVMAEIAKGFNAENVIEGLVSRHTDGVLGREPSWSLVPRRMVSEDAPLTSDEQTLIREAEAALLNWWDQSEALAALYSSLTHALLGGRGPLRLYIPDTEPVGIGALLQDAIMRIKVEAVAPDRAAVVTSSRKQLGIYLEITDAKQEQAELTYLDEQRLTALRIVGASGTTAEISIPLGGRLLMYELQRNALVSPQLMQNQRALNLALAQMMRNINLAGSRERIIFNAKPPGEIVTDSSAPGGKRFKPGTLKVGAGATNFVEGLDIRDQDGKLVGLANPNINYIDPVDPTSFTLTQDQLVTIMYRQAKQLHALISGDATASGESRKQARADYEKSLNTSKARVDKAGRWLLETVLTLAAALSGRPDAFASLRAEFKARIDVGPLSAEDQQQIRENVAVKLLGRQTGMERLDVDDPDAEQARIEQETAALGGQLLESFDRGA